MDEQELYRNLWTEEDPTHYCTMPGVQEMNTSIAHVGPVDDDGFCVCGDKII